MRIALPSSALALPGSSAQPVVAVSAAASALLAALGALAVMALLTMLGVAPSASSSSAGRFAPSAFALRDIPPVYLRLYQQAAGRYHLDWAILAAIGAIECDHGRSPDAGCHSGQNSAGAEGPMQFLAGTWRSYGVDGNHDGRSDPYDPADAIPAAARYLVASGAPGNYRRAIFAYNHADWYVQDVLDRADRYRGRLTTPPAAGPVALAPGDRPQMLPDGRLAAPTGAPLAVRAAIAAGNRLIGLPYRYGGGHASFHDTAYDCSGAVSYVLHGAGLLPAPEDSTSLQRYGAAGPGRWITVYAAGDHAFMYVAGMRMDTSPQGGDRGPAIGLYGPRWREGFRDHARFGARHPPGL